MRHLITYGLAGALCLVLFPVENGKAQLLSPRRENYFNNSLRSCSDGMASAYAQNPKGFPPGHAERISPFCQCSAKYQVDHMTANDADTEKDTQALTEHGTQVVMDAVNACKYIFGK